MADEYTVAIHEGGHVAVAHFLGAEVFEAALLRTENGDGTCDWDGRAKIETKAMSPVQDCQIAIAGPCAELRLLAAGENGLRDAEGAIDERWTLSIACASSVVEALHEVAHDGDSEQMRAKIALEFGGESRSSRLFCGNFKKDAVDAFRSSLSDQSVVLKSTVDTLHLINDRRIWTRIQQLALAIMAAPISESGEKTIDSNTIQAYLS